MTVFRENATIWLLFSYKLCIKSPFKVYVEVYINLLCVDNDSLTKENVSGEIYETILNLKYAEAFAVFLGDSPSYRVACPQLNRERLIKIFKPLDFCAYQRRRPLP